MRSAPIIAAVVAIAVATGGAGYAVGVYQTKAHAAKQVTDAARQAQQAANIEATYSAQSSASVDASVAASTQNVNTIKEAVIPHLERTQPKVVYKAAKCDGSEPNKSANGEGLQLGAESADSVRPWTFDRRTVGLLNAARIGLATDASSVGNGEGDTASTIGVPQFVENDLEIVGRYHALKAKHDALVSYLERAQAKGYGLCVAPETAKQQILDDP